MEFVLHKSNNEITNKVKVRQAFNELKDGRYLVRIDSWKKRSIQQNRYYWKCVVPLVKDGLRDVGYNQVKSNQDAHEILKHLFLKKKIVNENTDEVIEIAGSTADLKTVEFNNYLEEIWQWSSEYLGVVIPAPNEPLTIFNDNEHESKN